MAFKYKGLRLKDPSLMKRLRRVPNIKFTRASVAYDKNGNSVPINQPRFGIAGGPNDGVLIEEAHTNLLTANQSTGTDTLGDTTGFEGVRKSETITSSTEQSHSGTKSLKCVTPNLLTQEGIITSPISGLSNGVVYIFSAWVYAPNGADMYWFMGDGGDNNVIQPFTGTGAWQKVEYPFTPDGSPNHYVSIRTNTKQAITFYVDTLQLTTPYPLSWTLGGTTMAAETLTLPGHTLNPISGTIEVEAYIEPHHKGRAWVLLDQNNKVRVIHTGDGFLQFQTNNGVDTTTTPGIPDTDLVDGFNRVTARYNEDEISIMVNGDPDTLSVEADPSLPPTNTNPLTLDNSFNGLIRELTLSNTARPDNDAVARATRPEGHGFGVDRQVTLIAPLKNNLNAYRVATV